MKRTTLLSGTTTTVLALAVVLAAAAASGHGGNPSRTEAYTNPVSAGFADTFADPAVIRGKDGYWYAYGTTDPLREGEGTRHLLPISRSDDLVDWEHVGDAFTEETVPAWADTERMAALWAPDIRYVDGEYRLYYVVTDTTRTDEPNDNAIGVATAPTPAGPWTDSGAPVVEPRRGGAGEPGNFLWTFDPHHVSGPDGTEYLFYGSYYGGIFVTELSEDGTRAVGEPTRVTIDNKYEGAYVVQRDGWWYLFASTANCCAGPTTGYSVHVGRSRDLTGPYVDRQGISLTESRAGGTPVLYQNGNRWVGTGHNSVVTDLSGQDWIVYHAIDPADPYLDGTDGINERPMLLDPLDWVDGWPVVRGGRGPSEGRQRGPVTGPVTRFDDGLDRSVHTTGRWTTATSEESGRYAVSERAGSLLVRAAPPRELRVEADLRSTDGAAYGVVAGGWRHDRVRAVIEPDGGELTLTATERTRRGVRTVASESVALPENFSPEAWHSVVLEVRRGRAYAEVSDVRLGDPHAVVELDLPGGFRPGGKAGALAGGADVHVDNLSALRADDGRVRLEPAHRPGRPLSGPSDEFSGAPEPGWETVRTPEVEVVDGRLRWQVEQADLVGPGGTASLLIRDAPSGDWTVETKVTIDLGTDDVRNFQQAGLVAYVDDDLFARLSHVAIWNTRQTEFGKEMPFAGRTQFGGTIVGPPAETTWLRLVHRIDERNDERELQAYTSNDGRTWVEGGVWTLPLDQELRVGIVAHGLNPDVAQEPATAEFDYVRFFAD